MQSATEILLEERAICLRILKGETVNGLKLGDVGIDETFCHRHILSVDASLVDTPEAVRLSKTNKVIRDIAQLSSGTMATIISKWRVGLCALKPINYQQADTARQNFWHFAIAEGLNGRFFETWQDAWEAFRGTPLKAE